VFYLFGLSIACFLVLLILLKNGKTRSDYILLIWMILMAMHVTLFYLDHTKIIYRYPHLLGLALPLPVLHGALLYLYCVSVTRTHFIRPGTISLCLLPFAVMCMLIVPFLILPAEQKSYVFQHQGAGFEWFMVIQALMIPSCGLLFATITILEIRNHRARLLNIFSNSEKKMLTWLLYVTICMAVIWILSVPFDDPIIFDAVVLFILLIGLMGIRQAPVFYSQSANTVAPKIALTLGVAHVQQSNAVSITHAETTFRTHHHERQLEERVTDENSKYAKSGLKVESLPRLKRSLDDYMKHAKPYKDPDLSLDGLAALLHMPSNQLSQIINALEGKTFYHYINTYRISEFLEIAALPENKKFTYFGLANDCGFSSKSTFNKYFKLRTGKTPSEYFAV